MTPYMHLPEFLGDRTNVEIGEPLLLSEEEKITIQSENPSSHLEFQQSWRLLGSNTVILSDFPVKISVDENKVPHNASGPALIWPNGGYLYMWHGVIVPEKVITDPGSITLDQIHGVSNTETRRVMIEKYGASKYIKECGFVLDASEDEIRNPIRLYRREVDDDEPIVMLEMTNSTVDPDGSVRTYMRRVPPDITSAIEARNWVCGLDEGSRIDVQT